MRAVLSAEPLTKRRPSGSSAREYNERSCCLKVRRTAPSLTLKSLTVLSGEPESAGNYERRRRLAVPLAMRKDSGERRVENLVDGIVFWQGIPPVRRNGAPQPHPSVGGRRLQHRQL